LIAAVRVTVRVKIRSLLVTPTFGEDGRLTLDEKGTGVPVVTIALTLHTPVLLAVALAVVVTALARAFG
jgi:hypothetical protein